MFSNRAYLKEEMDDFNTSEVVLHDSLRKLSFINSMLGNTSVTLNAVKKILKRDTRKTFHIVDVGCGAGDNLRAIATWCSKNERNVKLTGIDGNNDILSYAKQQKSDIEILYKQRDILNNSFELESCDILISSHFIYRFTDQELVVFINRNKKKVSDTIIFSELQRSVIPYYAFRFFGKLLAFNKMVRQDGLKAIKNSFKREELRNILKQLDVPSHYLKWKWAFRYLILIKV